MTEALEKRGSTALQEVATPESAGPWWSQLFRSLRHKGFRLLWIGQALQSEGQWMEQVARGWLLWELSHDPFILGFYGALRNLPVLALALPAGILTDRLSRIALIQVSQVSACLLAFAFALLVHTGVVTVWMALVFAALNGASEALRMPARQSMVATLVPGRDLLNAIAVNEVAQYTMRIAGPVLAGVIMSAFLDPWTGVAVVFYVRGILYLISVVTTALIEAPPMPTEPRRRTIRQNLSDTVQYLLSNRVLLAIALLGAVPATFGQPYQHLMPVFALHIFQVGPLGLGVMSAMVGVGALLGSVVLAALGNVRRMGWLLFGSLFGYGVAMVFFGIVPWSQPIFPRLGEPVFGDASSIFVVTPLFLLALALLLLLGGSQAVFFAMRQALTQLIVRDEQRGRVVSVTQLTRGGLSPLGSLQAGALAGAAGAPVAVMVMGGILGGIALISGYFLSRLRELEYSEEMRFQVEAREMV